jgi:molecular chaperone DnaJ
MREKGIKGLNSTQFGDQYVQVNVFVPTSVGAAEKELLEKMRKSETFNPNSTHDDKGLFDKIKDVFS